MLSQKFQLGRHILANRIVLPPMVSRLATEDGFVTDDLLEHYRKRQGPGLVIIEATAVSQEGKLSPLQLGAYLPEHQEGLARLAQVVQRDGTPALVQLHHAGSHTDLESTGGLPLRSPSGVPVRGTPSRPLEEEEIWQLVDAFVRSAEMVLSAGFAGVEIHAAHGYLICQFLSPLSNKRTDSWGGTFEGRTKFLREVILRCKEIKKPEQILAMRLGLADWRQGGLEVEEGIEIARLARELGVELLDISFGLPGPEPESTGEFSSLLGLAAKAKEAGLEPVVGVGGSTKPQKAQLALKRGMADLVAVGRGRLADPAGARKATGREAGEINYCRQCPDCRVREGKCRAQLAAKRREGN